MSNTFSAALLYFFVKHVFDLEYGLYWKSFVSGSFETTSNPAVCELGHRRSMANLMTPPHTVSSLWTSAGLYQSFLCEMLSQLMLMLSESINNKNYIKLNKEKNSTIFSLFWMKKLCLSCCFSPDMNHMMLLFIYRDSSYKFYFTWTRRACPGSPHAARCCHICWRKTHKLLQLSNPTKGKEYVKGLQQTAAELKL